MRISDTIEKFLCSQLEHGDGLLEIQRSFLAEKFNCVPSQINYVIQTRFTNERGYSVESRRGGGGFIKIRKVSNGGQQAIMHIVNAIGDSIDFATCTVIIGNILQDGVLTLREASVMTAALSDNALRCLKAQRGQLRAVLLKNMLTAINTII